MVEGTADGERVGLRLLGLKLKYREVMQVDGKLVGLTEGYVVGLVNGLAVRAKVG